MFIGPLASLCAINRILIMHTIFVDGIVGQVHIHVIHIFNAGALVENSGETSKALFVNVDSHWRNTGHVNINP